MKDEAAKEKTEEDSTQLHSSKGSFKEDKFRDMIRKIAVSQQDEYCTLLKEFVKV